MKRKLIGIYILLGVLLTCIFGLCGCFGHVHKYELMVVSSDYLKSEATCTTPAVYYLSCECGKHGAETFEYGSEKGHTYSTDWDYDQTYHWHNATCGHDVISDKTIHNFGTNHICVDCGCVSEEVIGTELYIEGFTFKDDEYRHLVSNATTSFDFSGLIKVASVATYTKYTNSTMTVKKSSNTLNLSVGNNYLYFKVVYGTETACYAVNVIRNGVVTITFDSNGGSAIAQQTVEDGGHINFNALDIVTCEKEGYYLSGWTYNGKEFDTSYCATCDMTLVAVWSPRSDISYKVRHYFDGQLYTVTTKQGRAGDLTNATTIYSSKYFAEDFEQQIIKGDGSTIVEINYCGFDLTQSFEDCTADDIGLSFGGAWTDSGISTKGTSATFRTVDVSWTTALASDGTKALYLSSNNNGYWSSVQWNLTDAQLAWVKAGGQLSFDLEVLRDAFADNDFPLTISVGGVNSTYTVDGTTSTSIRSDAYSMSAFKKIVLTGDLSGAQSNVIKLYFSSQPTLFHAYIDNVVVKQASGNYGVAKINHFIPNGDSYKLYSSTYEVGLNGATISANAISITDYVFNNAQSKTFVGGKPVSVSVYYKYNGYIYDFESGVNINCPQGWKVSTSNTYGVDGSQALYAEGNYDGVIYQIGLSNDMISLLNNGATVSFYWGMQTDEWTGAGEVLVNGISAWKGDRSQYSSLSTASQITLTQEMINQAKSDGVITIQGKNDWMNTFFTIDNIVIKSN